MTASKHWTRHNYVLLTWERLGRGILGSGWLLLICSWPLISARLNRPLSDVVFLFLSYPDSSQLVIDSIRGTVSFYLNLELPIGRGAIARASSDSPTAATWVARKRSVTEGGSGSSSLP
jgi:hypothetical protein